MFMDITQWFQFSLLDIGPVHYYVQRIIPNFFFFSRSTVASHRTSYRTLKVLFLTAKIFLRHFQIFMLESFAKVVNGFSSLAIFE